MSDWPQILGPCLLCILWCLSSLTEAESNLDGFNKPAAQSPPQTVYLSDTERQWLADHPNIRFAGDPNWLPYEGFDNAGNYVGIVADYLKIIEQRLGIHFDIIQTSTWLDTVAKARAGDIDVISETTDSTLNNVLSFSQAYVSSRVIVVMDGNAPYVENLIALDGKKIAIIKEYGYLPQIINTYPQLNYIEVNTIQEGLEAVLTGKFDALLATASQATYHIAEQGYNNLRIVGATEFETKLALGLSAEFKPLLPLINRALDTVTQAQKSEIVNRWAWGSQSFITKLDQTLIYQVSAVFLFIMLVSVYWNRKLAKEINLREEMENQNQVLLDNIPLSVVVSQLDGTLISVNPQGADGYIDPNANISDLQSADFYSNAEERDAVKAAVLRDGYLHQQVVSFRKLDGSHRSMLVSIMPVQYQRQTALLSIGLDLTDRLQMEHELEQAKDSAELASRAKSEFLANMSHEIRTPMNAILGFTELLHEQISDSKLKGFVTTIRSAGNSLLMLINDILDVSKIEAGKLSIHKEPVNPCDNIDEISNVFQMILKNKNLDLLVDVTPNIPSVLYLDSARLRQILFNVVGNAVKFTEQGFVKIQVETETLSDPSYIALVIVVSDSGIGIAADNIDRIFESFHQQVGQKIGEYGGTGLGLTISQRLAKLMGGSLMVESTLGEGSTFTVRLDRVRVGKAELLPALEPQDTHKGSITFDAANILIVDDIEDNRHLLRETFLQLGLATDEANDGQQAVAMATAKPYDLIMMDIRMPIMDGYSAAQRIKALHSKTVIIALTASVMRDDYERQRREYFDAYLRKPALQKDLISVLKKYLPYGYQETISSVDEEFDLVVREPLKTQLADQFLAQIKGLQQSNNLKEISCFASEFACVESVRNNEQLTRYSNTLMNACEAFDVLNIKRLLALLMLALSDQQ